MAYRPNQIARVLSVSAALLAPAVATAQDQSLPLIERSFSPEGGDPSPCFVFWCYDRATFDENRVAAIGATYAATYLFARDRSGAWAPEAVLPVPEPAVLAPPGPDIDPSDHAYINDQYFGLAVALDGDELMVSHHREDYSAQTFSPRIYVYKRTRAGWTHRQTIPLDTCGGGLSSILLESGTALLGTCVFERDCHGNYVYTTRLAAEGGEPLNGYLAFDGRTVVSGTPWGNDGAGVAHVFQRHGSRWWQVARLTPEEGATDTTFGGAVAVDGRTLAIGAPTTPLDDPLRPGVVHLYQRRGNQWQHAQTIANPLATDNTRREFGAVLALDSNRLLAASSESVGRWTEYLPSVYLFERSGGTFAPSAILDGTFANSLFLSGNQAMVGETGTRGGTYPSVYELPSSCR